MAYNLHLLLQSLLLSVVDQSGLSLLLQRYRELLHLPLFCQLLKHELLGYEELGLRLTIDPPVRLDFDD